MKDKTSKRIILSLFVLSCFILGLFLGRFTLDFVPRDPSGYLDLQAELLKSGYLFRANNLYEKKHGEALERIVFDYSRNTAWRNDFAIDLTDGFFCEQKCYITPEKLEAIVLGDNYDFTLFGKRFAPLIAHAGGGYRTQKTSLIYTNAYETIKQNYELGHRFFEIDFHFTLDNKLAAVHNWSDFDHVVNERQWLMEKKYTEMLQGLTLTKVLDLMLVHRDMFLITDTKAYELNSEEQSQQFNLIYDEIIKRDASLLQRVIPQVYSGMMMEENPVLNHFPNVIFTLYAVITTTEDILHLLDDYPNIQMITTDILGTYIDDRQLINGIKFRNKKLSIHTVNEYQVFTDERYVGVDGYYTDFLTPKDWQLWRNSPKSML